MRDLSYKGVVRFALLVLVSLFLFTNVGAQSGCTGKDPDRMAPASVEINLPESFYNSSRSITGDSNNISDINSNLSLYVLDKEYFTVLSKIDVIQSGESYTLEVPVPLATLERDCIFLVRSENGQLAGRKDQTIRFDAENQITIEVKDGNIDPEVEFVAMTDPIPLKENEDVKFIDYLVKVHDEVDADVIAEFGIRGKRYRIRSSSAMTKCSTYNGSKVESITGSGTKQELTNGSCWSFSKFDKEILSKAKSKKSDYWRELEKVRFEGKDNGNEKYHGIRFYILTKQGGLSIVTTTGNFAQGEVAKFAFLDGQKTSSTTGSGNPVAKSLYLEGDQYRIEGSDSFAQVKADIWLLDDVPVGYFSKALYINAQDNNVPLFRGTNGLIEGEDIKKAVAYYFNASSMLGAFSIYCDRHKKLDFTVGNSPYSNNLDYKNAICPGSTKESREFIEYVVESGSSYNKKTGKGRIDFLCRAYIFPQQNSTKEGVKFAFSDDDYGDGFGINKITDDSVLFNIKNHEKSSKYFDYDGLPTVDVFTGCSDNESFEPSGPDFYGSYLALVYPSLSRFLKTSDPYNKPQENEAFFYINQPDSADDKYYRVKLLYNKGEDSSSAKSNTGEPESLMLLLNVRGVQIKNQLGVFVDGVAIQGWVEDNYRAGAILQSPSERLKAARIKGDR